MVVTDINAYVKIATAIAPVVASEGTINSSSLDRINYDSCVLVTNTGVATGSPSSFTVDVKIQHSDTGSGSWTDYTNPNTEATAAVTQITAVSTAGTVGVNLIGAKRYIRVVHILDFTGGSSPTLAVSAHVILGGAHTLPAV